MNIYAVTLAEVGTTTAYSTTFGTAPSVNQAGLRALTVEMGTDEDEETGFQLYVLEVRFIAEIEFGR